jgi:membrane-associated phospholipid phosphatase
MDATALLMDPGINIAAQNLSPALMLFVPPGEILDSTAWYLLVISVIFLGLHPRCGVRLAVMVGITAGLNEALKLAWHLPRPYWISPEVKVFSHHPSFGFPSGGAMYGAVIYGYIASVIRKWWAVAACAVLLVSTCLVRIFAGAHFALDVFGGLLFGFLILLLFFLAGPRAERYAAGLSPCGRYAGMIVLSLLPILLAVPAYLSLAGWQLPVSWTMTALLQVPAGIAPVSIVFAWGASGIILGSLAGNEILILEGGWAPPEEPWRKGVVVLAGTASVLMLNAVIATIRSVPDLPSPYDQAARVLCMALVLFWLTACVPLVARRAGFAAAEMDAIAGK